MRVQVAFGPEIVALGVPPEAVRNAPMRTYVYVAEEEETPPVAADESKMTPTDAPAPPRVRARSRDVVLGPTVDGLVAVLKGLDPDQQVIADGSFKLREGGLIFPVPAKPIASSEASHVKSE
ncbi:MAG: hypothetical protein U0892_15115 [Pirellulales bacterium]